MHFFISWLEPAEVVHYIAHRLKVAGCERAIFTARACERIVMASGGIPRSTNILCGMVLAYGYSAGLKRIDVDMV